MLAVNVDIGAKVKEGQVLAELDNEPFELDVQKVEADLATAHASVKKQQAEYDRQKRLNAEGATSERMVERAEFALKEAEASVESTNPVFC